MTVLAILVIFGFVLLIGGGAFGWIDSRLGSPLALMWALLCLALAIVVLA